MSDSGGQPFDERLERYLDDQLSRQDRADLERQLEADHRGAELVARQRQLDQLLRQAFRPRPVTPVDVERWLAKAGGTDAGRGGVELHSSAPRTDANRSARWYGSDRRRWLSVTAAGVLLLGTLWGLRGWIGDQASGRVQPYFQPRALTTIYTESVREGYQPYYFCEDEARFAATFAKRQQVPLKLAKMPPDRRMIGLSYSGGFTRDTTAILCEAHSQPVMVFVDRREADSAELTHPDSANGLNVHRRELGDLVLYEVGPTDSPQILDYLQIP